MMKLRPFASGLLASLVLCAAAHAADETYSIKLHRAFKVGDHYDTHIVSSSARTITVDSGGGAPNVKSETGGGDLTGRIEVTEVDKTGAPMGMVLTIKKLADGSGKEVLDAGREIVIKRTDADVTFSGDLSPDAKSLLATMFSKHKANSPTDDDIFGSKDKRKVGDQWDMDAAKAAENLSQSATTVAAADVTGKVSLKGVETANGQPALRAVGDMKARNVKPPAPAAGVEVTSCEMQVHFSGLYPSDEALPVVDCQTQIDMQMHAIVTGTPTNYDVRVQVTHTETITPIKK